tara:strand:+ start:133 stop:288 length:156 start_codon:yes stop_codon:yes gene_type:complete
MKKLKHTYKIIGKTLERILINKIFEVYPVRIGLGLPMLLALLSLLIGLIIL